MKIAVTSQNYRTVTGHAGKTRRFLVFDVNTDGEVKETDRLDLDKMMTMHEFRNDGGSHPLDQMDVLITGSAGAGFVQNLNSRDVQVIVTGETDPIQAMSDFQNDQVKPPAPESCNHDHHDHGHQVHLHHKKD